MGTRTITKAIDVDAPPGRVWDVLLDDATYRQWTAEFMAGSYAETDWQEGSTVRFLDPSGSGMLGHIVASRHPELVDIEFDGVVADGKDDTESDQGREFRGSIGRSHVSRLVLMDEVSGLCDGETRISPVAVAAE